MENTKQNIEKLHAAFLLSLVQARTDRELSQNTLAKMCNICQPVIARIESGKSCPTINTLFKILAPLNKTIKVVDIEPR